MASCPFGAVAEKSQMIDILRAIKSDKKVVAMIAPAIAGQTPVSINKVASGLIKAGFDVVMEVAEGADITAKTEAKDFAERMEKGDKFMTTSCCAAYREMVKKLYGGTGKEKISRLRDGFCRSLRCQTQRRIGG